LSGLFGDQLFVSDPNFPYQAADLLREGQVLSAIRACGEWGLATKRSILPLLWQAAIRPNVPMWLRPTQTKAIIPETISADLVARTKLHKKVREILELDARLGLGSIGVRYSKLMQTLGSFAAGYSELQTSFSCIEMRYPFL
jgi:hypothetical protein